MGGSITLEEGMTRLEEGITKAALILDGYPASVLFSPEEYMKYYDCVYQMCAQRPPHNYSEHILERFKKALKESIRLRVLPSLVDKDGAPLLAQFLYMWTNYKAMSKCLGGFFLYLDCQCERKSDAPLEDVVTCFFHELVCKPFLHKLFSAAVSLITQDRNGELIDRDLLQNISQFFMVIGKLEKVSYYDKFEAVILADTAEYYSHLASQLLLCYSSRDYVLKVEQYFNEEKARACHFLDPPSVEKLLQILHLQLVDQIANKLNEKRRAENLDLTTYQEFLCRCANLSIR